MRDFNDNLISPLDDKFEADFEIFLLKITLILNGRAAIQWVPSISIK